MSFELQHASRVTKLILIGEFLLVAYLLYALTTHIYQNYQVDYHIQNFQEMNDKLAHDNQKAAEDLLYSRTDAYAEKMAKQNLGLVNPGEEVVVISNDLMSQPVVDSRISDLTAPSDAISKYYYLSNPEKWWKFFFEIDHTAKTTARSSS